MNKVKIHFMKPAEYYTLREDVLPEFFCHAIFFPRYTGPLSRSRDIDDPSSIFIVGFGDWSGDCGVVAEQDGKIIGVGWMRKIPELMPPFLAISVLPEYRNQGIGTKLMRKLLGQMFACRYKQTAISVGKENQAAIHFFQRLDYRIVSDDEEDENYIMIRDFYKENRWQIVAGGISFVTLIALLVLKLTNNADMWLYIALPLTAVIVIILHISERFAVVKRKKRRVE